MRNPDKQGFLGMMVAGDSKKGKTFLYIIYDFLTRCHLCFYYLINVFGR